ncbi:YidC/Oxa1 family membrane protein insertase [Zalerion maritima]|uniref:YidC/Oxa1 family membrane protein insertase n=1 Tax=Zalerion maritima TaxID=339359 RepID=A0AAD5WWI4_9PEZI|nr:YidC/Oxa1 family membrane protein insertase [Zalerion maritima]
MPLLRRLPGTPRRLHTSRPFSTSPRTSNGLNVRALPRGGFSLSSRTGDAPSMAAAASMPFLYQQQQLRNASSWWNPASYVPNAINPWGSSKPASSTSTEPPPPTLDAAADASLSTAPAGTDPVSTASASSSASPSELLSNEATSEISKLSEQFSGTDADLADLGLDPASLSESLLNIPEQIGFLSKLGLDFGWGTSTMVQWFVEHLYVYAGMPWWGTFAACALLFRLLPFKFTMDSMEMSGKMNLLFNHPKFKETVAEMQAAGARGDNALMIQKQQETFSMSRMAGVSFKPLILNFLTIPFGFSFFRVIRAMCDVPVPSLETGGLLWFTDLTVPDPYYCLPVFAAAGMVALIRSTPAPSARGNAMTKVMLWVTTPLMLVVSFNLAAGLQWFFCMTGLVSFGLNLLRLNPTFRVALGYPPKPPGAMTQGSSPSPGSPISPSSISYQAPRTPGTPSNPAVLPSSETILKEGLDGAVADQNPKDNTLLGKIGLAPAVKEIKTSWKDAMGQTEEKVNVKKSENARKKAESYEERREREEEEALRARMEARKFKRIQ